MQLDGWCFYEEPLRGKRVFHPRRRKPWGPLFSLAIMALAGFEIVSRF